MRNASRGFLVLIEHVIEIAQRVVRIAGLIEFRRSKRGFERVVVFGAQHRHLRERGVVFKIVDYVALGHAVVENLASGQRDFHTGQRLSQIQKAGIVIEQSCADR